MEHLKIAKMLKKNGASDGLVRTLHGQESSKGMTMKAATVFQDALKALEVLHDGGWVHQDIKPDNLGVMDSPNRCVLSDLDRRGT